MKKILFIITILILAGTGCVKIETRKSPSDNEEGTVEQTAALANPASVYCEEQGGKLEIRKEPAGENGVCVFSDGSECEEWAYFRGECQTGEKDDSAGGESKNIARDWILANSPTYRFDGAGLNFMETKSLTCSGCFEHLFSFTSSQAGYGDRTGEILAQMMTPHEIRVETRNGAITSAITDNKYDEIKKELLPEVREAKSLKISLIPQNDSGEAGVAVVAATLNETEVLIELASYPLDPQPVYIQKGSCAKLGEVSYKLNSATEGKSKTILNISLDDLMASLPLAINVYKDAASSASCGDILP
ncbi:MAG: DUF333 domain-containing protein [Patescibacteria group bacterium]|nr:DUF333 domain-containing protein [Patescibacteria group bacterium]MDD5490176.1 DUF333 domain-containing protein [Patescibacteria group bacterium]